MLWYFNICFIWWLLSCVHKGLLSYHFQLRLLHFISKSPFISGGSAVTRWLRQQICTQKTWVQLPLIPVGVTGSDKRSIWSKLNPCTSKSPTCLGRHVRALNKGDNDIKFKLWLTFIYFRYSILINIFCSVPNRHYAYWRLNENYYVPAPWVGGIKRWWYASDVCLSHTLGLSREQRGLGRLKLAQR